MEPLTAIGLAGNIFQFIEFASGLALSAHKLYRSVSDSTQENKEIEILARDFQQLAESEELLSLLEKTEGVDGSISREDRTLKDLRKQCTQVANELIALLDSLKIKGQHRGVESVYRVVKTAWKKEDIGRLQQRLDRISSALNSYIQKTQQNRILRQMNLLHDDNLRLQAARTQEIAGLKTFFTDIFEGMASAMERKDSKALTRALLRLPQAVAHEKKLSYEQFILRQLFYLTMDNRHFAIPKEHAKTFQWIFDGVKPKQRSNNSVNFVTWLRSDSNLYWITGKPGSGKSTLMKFLVDNGEVNTCLLQSKWLQHAELITASFFFWSSARDPLQKSQAGLLRSILYQILRKCPDLIPVAFPTDEFSVDDKVHDTTFWEGFLEMRTLLTAIENISKGEHKHRKKFFFLIDGLDEYDGSPADVIQLIETLQQCRHIKLCVSSRPWNEFQGRFGTGHWNLSVHELTRGDIRIYVDDNLGADPVFRDLRKRDKRSLDLVQKIIDSADGVFLWVFLVIRSLLEGLTNADRIVDLQKRLSEFPTDLEAYFEKILSTVEGRYQQQMANAFIITLETTNNLPLLCHWFLDELDEDPEYMFKLDTAALTEDETMRRMLQAIKRLNARCKGLLEMRVVPDKPESWSARVFTWHVDFLHRTARDFLALSTMQQRLRSWANDSCTTDSHICNSIVALVKSAPSLTAVTGLQTQLMETFFAHMERLQQQTNSGSLLAKQLPLELEQALLKREISDYVDWTDLDHGETIRDQSSSRLASALNTDLGFITTCASAGLSDYIINRLKSQPALVEAIGSDLLISALIPLREKSFRARRRYVWGAEKANLVSLLLQMGVNPTHTHHMNVVATAGFPRQSMASHQFFSDMIESGKALSQESRLLSLSPFICCHAFLVNHIDPCTYIACDSPYGRGIVNVPLYQALRTVFTDEQYLSLHAVFHPKTNRDATKIRQFLYREGIEIRESTTVVQETAPGATVLSSSSDIHATRFNQIHSPMNSALEEREQNTENPAERLVPNGRSKNPNIAKPPKMHRITAKPRQGFKEIMRNFLGQR